MLPLPVSLGKAVYEATQLPLCMQIIDLISVLTCPGIFPRDPTYRLKDRVSLEDLGNQRGQQ